MIHFPDRPVFKSLCDEYGPEYVREHFFDDNGVKDSAPEELKAEYKDVKIKHDLPRFGI